MLCPPLCHVAEASWFGGQCLDHSLGCKDDRLMGFDSIPVKELEALAGSLLSQTLLRNGDCHTAEDLGKRREQETQDYQLHLSSCYSV